MKKPPRKKKKLPFAETVGELIKNLDKVDRIMEAINFYKDGFDNEGIQLWSRKKGVERVLTDWLVVDGKFIVRFNIIENCFEYPAGMTSLIGSPRVVNGFVKLIDSPGLISLEGFPANVKGSIDHSGTNNLNPMEKNWVFRSRERDENNEVDYDSPKYVNYWEEYFEYVKELLIDSNLPKEYLNKINELDITSLATERSIQRINLVDSKLGIEKFKL